MLSEMIDDESLCGSAASISLFQSFVYDKTYLEPLPEYAQQHGTV